MSDPLPKHHEFMLPTLRALDDLGGSGSIDEIEDRIITSTHLTPEQLDISYPTSGAPVATHRMAFARTWLKFGDFVASGGRGVWLLTDKGREALSWPPSIIRKQCEEAYKAQRAERAASQESTEGEADDLIADQNADNLNSSEKHWSDVLLNHLKAIEPSAFERLSQRILRESGFVKVEVTGKSGDGGIDGTGVLRMNLISFQVLFQCKRYAGSVGAGAVRDFRGAMQGRADKGLIITTGTFTPDARKEATRDGAPAIDLIDGEALCYLLKDLKLGVDVREIQTEEVTVNESFFEKI
ncbi:MAG: restriction endonuclease [Sphingomonadaceae bacterium]|nr:restriction endonuclease [Sphingomonadaceae bacterium]